MNATHPKPFSPTGDHGQIISDSGVFVNGQGYERVIMVRGWRGRGWERQLAQVRIRVDRFEIRSYAMADVWSESTQSWTIMVRLHPKQWWSNMQGYQRAAGKQAEIDTRLLAEDVIDELQQILT